MVQPVTRAGMIPAYIERARILDVDINTYTVSIATEFSKKPQTGISFATPYQHYVNGEGIYFMPEIGSLCWVCFPSDGHRPFVLTWAAASNEGNFRSMKNDLNPGDIYLGTRDENKIVLRRGGVIEIGAGPLSQRFYIPVNNAIVDYCENYGLHTLGGDLEWTISRPENTTDGSRPANLKVSAREFANDPNPIAVLEMGSHADDTNAILTLKISQSGQQGADTTMSLNITKDGQVSWTISNNLTITTVNDISMTSSSGNVNITANNLAQITANALQFTAKGSDGALIKALGGYIQMNTPKGVKILGPGLMSLQVDGAQYPVVLATPEFVQWVFHQHISGAPGNLTSPPVPPLLPPEYQSKSIWSS